MSPRTPAPQRGPDIADPVRTIAERVKELRKERRLTAADLGAALTEQGVPWDRFTVAALEGGKRKNVTIDELLALAKVFDVAPLALAVEGDPDPELSYARALLNEAALRLAARGGSDDFLDRVAESGQLDEADLDKLYTVRGLFEEQRRHWVTDASQWLTRDLPAIQANRLRRINDPATPDPERERLRVEYADGQAQLAEAAEVLGSDENA
jgi:transcriptional regulator with XRE-family HTH domain